MAASRTKKTASKRTSSARTARKANARKASARKAPARKKAAKQKSAKKKSAIKKKQHLCAQPVVRAQVFAEGVTSIRARYVLTNGKKWLNGTELTYCFVEGAKSQRTVVKKAFAKWKSLKIGLTFVEVTDPQEALIRIGFDHSDGSWSYVGRDNLTIPKDERTMNFGWDLAADDYGMSTALHEIGHAIGFEHEHQSPFSGIEWNKAAVYKEFTGPPNKWTKSQIDSNIIAKLPANKVKGSTWDPDSIMEYEFGPGLVATPEAYQDGIYPSGALSKLDIAGVRSFYPGKAGNPAKLGVNKSAAITAVSGGQDEFTFVAPSTRKYTFQTTGELDTVMVVSEKVGTKLYYLAGDDDGGTEKNAKVELPLVKGRTYVAKVRVLYAAQAHAGSMMVV